MHGGDVQGEMSWWEMSRWTMSRVRYLGGKCSRGRYPGGRIFKGRCPGERFQGRYPGGDVAKPLQSIMLDNIPPSPRSIYMHIFV